MSPRFHVFSKMFQPPVTRSPEELCALLKSAGVDGVQWTVRPGGHVTPENVSVELPRLVKTASRFGLACESICTAITPDGSLSSSKESEKNAQAVNILKVAADCGIRQFRTGYYFYDEKNESFEQSLNRIRKSFAALAALGEETGVKAVYQNHSTWGPAIFGGVVWDIYTCIRDLDPRFIGVEYDPMHAYFETFESWRRGFELIAPWIAAIDLKDFRCKMHEKKKGHVAKNLVAAGQGIVPWKEVACRIAARGIDPFYIVHFEYDFDKTDLVQSVRKEITTFRNALTS
jgi:sugar phosphate isomerase/epimerase